MIGKLLKLIGNKAKSNNSLDIAELLNEKDPLDLKLTDSSSEWKREGYCPTCKSTTTHNEQVTNICLSCGTFDSKLIFSSRSFRNIWNGKEWVINRKYQSGKNTVVDPKTLEEKQHNLPYFPYRD